MSWSQDFVDQISGKLITPVYLLESFEIGAAPIPNFGGAGFAYASIGSGLPGTQAWISPDNSSVSYGAVSVGEWTYSFGQLEIGLTPAGGESVRFDSTRGQGCRLAIGFPGWDYTAFQTVFLGQVQNVVQRGDEWTIVVRSMLAALTSRWQAVANQGSLFYKIGPDNHGSLGTATYVETTDFIAASSTTITVDSTTNVEQEGSEGYILRVQPDSGDAFYLHATTLAANVFSGLTTLFDSTRGDVLAQTAAPFTNNVEIGALIKDEAGSGVRKILCSTGTALANGFFDALPASFGMGIADEHIDDTRWGLIETILTPEAGHQDLYIHAFVPEPDGLAFIQSILTPLGAFLCERQGQISIGCITDEDDNDPPVSLWEVDDTELAAIEEYQAWNDGQPVEYEEAAIELLDGSESLNSTSAIKSRPTIAQHRVLLPYVQNSADMANWADDIHARTKRWYLQVGEYISIKVAGWRLARAAPGDRLTIFSTRIGGRTIGSDLGFGAPSTIISVETDWFGSSTRIRCVHIPPAEQG